MNKRKRAAGTKTREFVQWITAFAVIIAVVVSGRILVKAQSVSRFDVYLEDQFVGTVSDPDIIKRWKAARYEELERQYPSFRVTSNMEKLHFENNKSFQGLIDNDAVIALLNDKIVLAFFATEIRIDGRSVGIVKDYGAAADLLARFKEPYLVKKKQKDVHILSGGTDASAVAVSPDEADFVQDVQLVETFVPPASLEPMDVVAARIAAGTVQPKLYIVEKGDSLSVIAKRFALSVQGLRELNPGLSGDRIRIGQTLNLSVAEPLLSVRTRETFTEELAVPSGIVYEKDPELRAGVIQIVSPGKPGLKRVTKQTVRINGAVSEVNLLEENLMQEPVAALVRQGTKVVRGIGTGQFSMPVVSAEVTSQYGVRWGTAHKGTDFVSDEKGILASDHGEVTYAGWKTGYGNCIVINHHNGFETLYGHLSKIEVHAKDKVSKGEKIGIMGNTGNSTGVHLHFEIIKNGDQQNPMKFLSR